MTVHSNAAVPTANGSRYLQQLCKHWSHNLAVEFTAETGKVVFPRNARGADCRAMRRSCSAQRATVSNVGWKRASRDSSRH